MNECIWIESISKVVVRACEGGFFFFNPSVITYVRVCAEGRRLGQLPQDVED